MGVRRQVEVAVMGAMEAMEAMEGDLSIVAETAEEERQRAQDRLDLEEACLTCWMACQSEMGLCDMRRDYRSSR
jgi:hypothetical protein